jgi:hypothetical protein
MEASMRCREEIAHCLEEVGCLPITEIMLRRESGARIFLDAIFNDESFKYNPETLGRYKIKFTRMLNKKNEWIDATPGAVYWHDRGFKPFAYNGKKMVQTVKSECFDLMEQRGDRYDPVIWEKFVLDGDCCITTSYNLAWEIMLRYSRAGGRMIPRDRHVCEQIFTPKQTTEIVEKRRVGRPALSM